MRPERWERIQSVYLDAAELPVANRSAFLDRACADDADLRREVETLLSTDRAPDPLLDATIEDLALLMDD